MEYSCKHPKTGHTISLNLGEYSMIFKCEAKEKIIAYANITAVRLSRISNFRFKITINLSDNKPLVISSLYFTEPQTYATFVRVLHYHLNQKSKSKYLCGSSLTKVIFWAACMLTLSLLASFGAQYFNISVINPWLQTLLLFSGLGIIVFLFNIARWPKSYSPVNIPLQFLP